MGPILTHFKLNASAVVFLLAVSLFSCTSKQKYTQEKEPRYETLDTTSLQANPIAVLAPEDSIKIKSNFELMLAKVEDSLVVWGYPFKEDVLLSSKESYQQHWLLKNYFNKSLIARTKRIYPDVFIPTVADWQKLVSIKQMIYKNGSAYVIEEWVLSNRSAANTWMHLIADARHIDNTKPMRNFWVEGNKIYMVVTLGSTYQRYEHTKIFVLMAGHKPAFIKMMTNPINIPSFKKRVGGAHSGGAKPQPYFYKPDTVGVYYHFWIFSKIKYDKTVKNHFNSLHLTTYIYGKVKDYFNANEEFISLKANHSYHQIGKLNFVGQELEELEAMYGKPQLNYKGSSIYYYNKTFLILHNSDQKVDWFRYIRTYTTLDDIENLPSYLFEYGKNGDD